MKGGMFMQGTTHRAGGMAFALVGFEVMHHNELLLPDVNPLIQLAIFYPIAQWSSTIPDLDHHWGSTPYKTPVTRILHFFLHLTKPKHRSWQTHSVLVTGGLMLLIYMLAFYGKVFFPDFSAVDWVLIQLMTIGFILGLTSHLFLDLINPSGVHLIPGMKIHLVPKTSFFATGGTWEKQIIFPLCYIISGIMALFIVIESFGIDVYGFIGGIMPFG